MLYMDGAMKTVFNLTTDLYDLGRFKNQNELESLMAGFDGIELMYVGDDTRGIIKKEYVTGFHMYAFPYWFDMWKGNEQALLDEFGTPEDCERYYGGTTRDALIGKMKAELEIALRYEAEYVVFHVADSSITESLTRHFRHTDEEIVEAACEFINNVFHDTLPLKLLLENLWFPGLTFTRPEITRLLLDGIKHKNTGIMLDTGHLLHTNTNLRTQEEGIKYIHQMLDKHGELCGRINGVHLNQSLTGEFAVCTMNNPPSLAETFSERVNQHYAYIFQLDRHQPFTCGGVAGLIKRISPDYLTFEFITNSLEEHRKLLAIQMAEISHY